MIRKTLTLLLAALFTIVPLQNAHALGEDLPRAPLFLSSVVEPNIYFTLDDSGSMDFGPMVEEGIGGFAVSGGLPIIDGRQRAYYVPTWTNLYSSRRVLPPLKTNDSQWQHTWIYRTVEGNGSYYNPDVEYVPWPGVNYGPANPTAVREHPDRPTGKTEIVDLTQWYTFTENTPRGTVSEPMWIATYYEWIDTDNDGVIERTDDYNEVRIQPGTDEMQNFANWLQYYRTRYHAMKSIIGNTINETTSARMGYSMFNQGRLRNMRTMSDDANKTDLLSRLYSDVVQARGTPARIAMRDVGNYFDNTGSSAPILSKVEGGECQQNFNIFLSDGFWNGNSPGVGNRDGDNNTEWDGYPYGDTYTNTLADVAMRNYERDLRGDLNPNVPTIENIDENTEQHLVTYTIAFGLKGTLDPNDADPLSAGFEWPRPVAGEVTTVDDMWHAAYNGRGKYLSAQNPARLQEALSDAIQDISERTGTAAAVAVNSARLSTESVIYLAEFNSNGWQGDLQAFPIINVQTGQLATDPSWNAGPQLTARNVLINPRTIFTYDGSAGVPFQWDDISDEMRADLNTNPNGDPDGKGEARLEYLRGSRANENKGEFFRQRLSVLGDLVNSGPVFVGEPALRWPDFAPFPEGDAAYSKFKNGAAKNRAGVVYVGANDGMLHGFSAEDGEEVFAYVPNFLASNESTEGLHYLTDPGYVHKFYVDLTPSVSDVFIDGKWNTVLVGGVRGGGRGIFAINVTDPEFKEDEAANVALWEFDRSDDADLGFTYSRPGIGMANNGKFVAIFGNGYNSDTGAGALYVVDMEDGSIMKKFTFPGDLTNPNGLASPALADLDSNGTIDRVYVGDIQGNMWAIDMSDTGASTWNVVNNTPLFTTNDNRPITTPPVLAKNPVVPDTGSNQPNTMVFFGTGRYLTDTDKDSTDVDSFYGVWDINQMGRTTANLVKQEQDDRFPDGFVLTRNSVNWTTQYGWWFDLPDPGERSITFPIARKDIIFFNSYVPVDDPCEAGGFGYPYAVDMATGGSADRAVFDANGDNEVNEEDTRTSNDGTLTTRSDARGPRREGVAIGDAFLEDRKFTGDESTLVEKLPFLPTGRFSWQELIK